MMARNNTVVLADDHAFFLGGLLAALETAGWAVTGKATDGKEALDLIEECDPEVVILDVRMPRMDGVTALEQLRKRGDDRPVILLANEFSDGQIKRLLHSGANSILQKDGPEQRIFQALDIVRNGARVMDDEIVDRALAGCAMQEAKPNITGLLSERESAVAERVVRGLRNREIGDELGLAEGTVKVYLHAIYSKLGIASRTELALMMRDAAHDSEGSQTGGRYRR